MLAAEEDLANKVAELAEKRGLTVYQTVNDILEQAIRAEKQGLNLKEVVDRRGDMERAREMGLTWWWQDQANAAPQALPAPSQQTLRIGMGGVLGQPRPTPRSDATPAAVVRALATGTHDQS